MLRNISHLRRRILYAQPNLHQIVKRDQSRTVQLQWATELTKTPLSKINLETIWPTARWFAQSRSPCVMRYRLVWCPNVRVCVSKILTNVSDWITVAADSGSLSLANALLLLSDDSVVSAAHSFKINFDFYCVAAATALTRQLAHLFSNAHTTSVIFYCMLSS